MKIHTTQNLELLKNNISANKTDFRTNYALTPLNHGQMNSLNSSDFYERSMSFKGKLPKNSENSKKIIDAAKKGLKDIKDKATPEVQKGDGFLKSSFFNACLKLASYENVFSAATAALICIFLRPLTIMALPTNDSKSKEKADAVDNKAQGNKKAHSVAKTNNMYASAQSIASGIAGLFSAVLLTVPFKKGQDHVLKNLHEYLSADKIKELYPWVDKASLIGKDGKILAQKFWKGMDGLPFVSDIKGCDMLPEFRRLADVSKETFEKILKVDIDYVSQNGKSFNDVIDKNGKKLYDVIDFNKLGITVKEEGFKDTQILLKDFNRDYLEKVVADSKGVNEWGNLDVNSVYENGVVKDFRFWKDTEGKSWKLDLDSVEVASELETANYKPRFSGDKRFDKKDQEWKFVAHQANGVDGKLGTKITNEMVEADANNVGLIKCLTWLPDITFRVPIAVGTIALIPWVLKNVFHLEKVKPNAEVKEDAVKNNVDVQQKENVSFKGKTSKSQNDNNVSFKGGKPDPKKASWLTKLLAKWYGKPLLESSKLKKFSEWLTKVPGDATDHMVVLGSLIQSGVYVNRTLSNKDLDNDRKKTLAINQALCFFIPTIAGYIVNNAIGDSIKKVSYRYTGLMKEEIAKLKAAGDEVAAKKAGKIAESLGKNIKGVGILARLASFTLIYRYLTPVLVTPVANKLGDKYFSKKEVSKNVA